MAIIDDYAGIAAELRRIQAEKKLPAEKEPADDDATWMPGWPHLLRATPAGEARYRRLVLRSRQ